MTISRWHSKRGVFQQVLAMVLGVVLGYGLAEVATRLFVPDPAYRQENHIDMWQEDPQVGYKNKVNFHDYAHGFIRVETNSLGFRGEEVSVNKPPSTFRVLGLGDSVTWGVGVQDEDTYLSALKQKLNGQFTTTHLRFETINTGVVGYSIYQELLTLMRDGLPLCPDLVTVGYAVNDFYPTEDPFHNVRTFHQPTNEKIRRRFLYPEPKRVHFYFYRFARSQAGRAWRFFQRERGAQKMFLDGLQEDWPPDSFEMRAWPVIQDHFRTMKRATDKQGIPLLILLFPAYPQLKLGTKHPFPQNRIGEFLASEKIDFIDLFDAFQREQQEVFVDWIHPNPLGHRLVAEEILRHMEKKHWLSNGNSSSARTCVSGTPSVPAVTSRK
jgi:lysophospholipase L1-like esterase